MEGNVGSQRAKRSDVAMRAGVSKSTVTFVLNDRYDIAIPETTRERVRQAARDLRYRPSPIARALASGRTNMIAVAFPNLVQHYVRVLQTLERRATASSCHIIASTAHNAGQDNVTLDLTTLMSAASDGVILVDMPPGYKDLISEALFEGNPAVSVGIYEHDLAGVDSVVVNLQKGAEDALAHLLESRPNRVAIFGPGPHERPGIDSPERGDPRMLAYCSAMRRLERPVEMIVGRTADRRTSIDLLTAYIRANGCPDALFCFDDELALSAHLALRRMGRHIPKDVLLVGCDGSTECEYVDPPISTVAQPIEEMCELAWRFLWNRIRHPNCDRQRASLDMELVIRASSMRS